MKLRYLLPFIAVCLAVLAHGQAAKLQVGKSFSRVAKDASGDVYAVMGGVLVGDKEGLVYVEDNLVQKVVRLDGQMNTAEELRQAMSELRSGTFIKEQ